LIYLVAKIISRFNILVYYSHQPVNKIFNYWWVGIVRQGGYIRSTWKKKRWFRNGESSSGVIEINPKEIRRLIIILRYLSQVKSLNLTIYFSALASKWSFYLYFLTQVLKLFILRIIQFTFTSVIIYNWYLNRPYINNYL
jgi:hypothetical protein